MYEKKGISKKYRDSLKKPRDSLKSSRDYSF